MLKHIAFKAGRNVSASPLSLSPSAVTIFVGPNNSGKSKALQEIESFSASGSTDPNFKVISNIEFCPIDEGSIPTLMKELQVPLLQNETVAVEHVVVSKGQFRSHVQEKNYIAALMNPSGNSSYFAKHYAKLHTVKLDGVSRLSLLQNASPGSFFGPPGSPLHAIWADNEKRRAWRDTVFSAFRFYPVIDATHSGALTIRTSTVAPTEDDERSFKESAVEFHRKARPISEYSDGVKAFTGIMLQIIAGEPRLILIDEPEAFLHPSLCQMLGREITNYLSTGLRKEDVHNPSPTALPRQLFVATHSAEFVMGCIQAKMPINIVRLTYDSPIASARSLPPTSITTLMRRPLLRSSNSLAGLFYNSVIVTEADADRAFYQELNERLASFKPDWAVPNPLFLNSNGKDTVSDLVKPLRGIGTAAAAIVDLDVLQQGGASWVKFLDACGVPLADRPSFEAGRKTIHEALAKKCDKYQREGGVDLLTDDGEREAALNLLSRLEEYGLFVVAKGEIERWLPSLDIGRGKATWLANIFEALGDDPSHANYVQPGSDDVWEFLFRIRKWLLNGSRKGLA
jgi:hypothetical protein